jgi:hypothetical protein
VKTKGILSVILMAVFTISGPFLRSHMSPEARGEERSFTIQIGAFRSLKNAEGRVKALRKMGHRAFFNQVTTPDKGKWYKVYLERYGSREEAEKGVKIFKEQGLISHFLIRAIEGSKEIDLKKGEGKPGVSTGKPKVSSDRASSPPDQRKQAQKRADADLEAAEAPLVIRDISFKPERGGKESVMIQASRFFSPQVFTLEGDRPRFVIDIRGTSSFGMGGSEIIAGGERIKRIRAHHQRDSGTLRVVLDLRPSRDYTVNQVFFETENIYALYVGSPGDSGFNGGETASERKGEGRGSSIQLRTTGEDIARDEMRVILVKNNFYASCWNHNNEFCNPDGDFDNFLLDNGNETVTDYVTRLMWQKGGSPGPVTYKDARSYVQKLNRSKFAGYSDWRLPTVEELGSLIERSWKSENLFIDGVFDKNQESCWSADTQGPGRAWEANFHLGYLVDDPAVFRNSVRAVRTEKAFAYE